MAQAKKSDAIFQNHDKTRAFIGKTRILTSGFSKMYLSYDRKIHDK